MSNFEVRAHQLASYVLSEGHEYNQYLQWCRECGVNPLLILENEHIFLSASYVQNSGNIENVLNEIFSDGEVSLSQRIEAYEKMKDYVSARNAEDLSNEILDEFGDTIDLSETAYELDKLIEVYHSMVSISS